MRVLVIPTTDWTKHPVPNRMNFIFDRLAAKHDVYVIHFELERFANNRERHTNCDLVKVRKSNVKDLSAYYALNSPSHARTIKRTLREEAIDVIVCANILPSFTATFVNGGIPIVFDYLDHFEESVAIYYPRSVVGAIGRLTTRFLLSHVLSSATTVTTVTREFKEYLGSRGCGKVEVIPNGVDTEVVRPVSGHEIRRRYDLNGLVLGYVGSLEYWIDLESILQSVPDLLELGLDVQVLIVGPTLVTDYIMKLRDIAAQLGIEKRVVMTGPVPYGEISSYISAMDICLNPRKPLLMNTLTMGSKVLNYVACGKPVLSTNMPCLKRLFGPSSGFFFYEEGDFVEQVETIANMEHRPENYRKTALEYDWDVLASRYEQALLDVMSMSDDLKAG